MNTRTLHFDAVIVGAGWAGLWVLHALRQKGLRCVCVEASEDVGGVWCYTKYPGCRNETETPIYQFSLEETWTSWSWTERFPKRDEIQAYLRHACSILGLYEDLTFNKRITDAFWDSKANLWTTYVGGIEFATAKFFLPCTGYTGKKYVPDLRGLDSFHAVYHTSEWPADLEYEGKRVGVIGTGSSGIQIIETIGRKVDHLTVFQRTPNMAIPRYQELLDPISEKNEQRSYPQKYEGYASSPTGLGIAPLTRKTFDVSRKERQAVYRSLWAGRSHNFWFGNFSDMLIDPRANLEAYKFWRKKTQARIKHPKQRNLLAPRRPPYAFGTKRPSLESDYFEIYNQANVDLVDLQSDSIEMIESNGVMMRSGSFHELDILVLATGFDFAIGSQLEINIRGEGQVRLSEKWGVNERQNDPDHPGILTYLGIMSSGFPNMLMALGPQTPTAFSITPRLAELQGSWIATCVEYVSKHGCKIETSIESERAWKESTMQVAMATLIPQTRGWYMGTNIPGRMKQPLFWLGGLPAYMEVLAKCARNSYAGFIIN